jgi:hypothetical protein
MVAGLHAGHARRMINELPGGSPDGDLQPARRRTEDADRHDVSPGSPVGRALIGTAAGDVVRVELPGGRLRELRVLRVVPTPSHDPAAERAA